jgi:hypothetical protein
MEARRSSNGGEEGLWVLPLLMELDQLHLREGLLLRAMVWRAWLRGDGLVVLWGLVAGRGWVC